MMVWCVIILWVLVRAASQMVSYEVTMGFKYCALLMMTRMFEKFYCITRNHWNIFLPI
jgi:NADH:ubiquinone oxidoreductase subunit H